MNIERYHAIVSELHDEARRTEYPALVEQLATGLREAVADPAQPDPQTQISDARTRLDSILRTAPSSTFSPAWRQATQELGVADLYGERLADSLNEIFSRNEITLNIAADEIEAIHGRLQAFEVAMREALSSLQFFETGTEELEPGEFEIGFLIPRGAVDDGLEGLGEEFVRLKAIIAPFSELVGEGRPDFKIRSLSSSDFFVFLEAAAVLAVIFGTALDRILAAYERILNIRLKHRELAEDTNVPDETLQPIAEYASGVMAEEIAKIVEDVTADAQQVNEGRVNELRIDLTNQLNALADRIDRGYNVDVRTGALPAPEEEEDGEGVAVDLDEETRSAAAVVLEKQQRMKFMNVSGKPILHLEQPEEPPGEEGRGGRRRG